MPDLMRLIVPHLDGNERTRIFNLSRATRRFLFSRDGGASVDRVAGGARSYALLVYRALWCGVKLSVWCGGKLTPCATAQQWADAVAQYRAEGDETQASMHIIRRGNQGAYDC